MTKFSNGERLRQRLPRGARGGPEGAAGAAAPRRRRAGGRRALQGQSGGGAAPRRRPGGGPGSAGVGGGGTAPPHTAPGPLRDGRARLDPPALPPLPAGCRPSPRGRRRKAGPGRDRRCPRAAGQSAPIRPRRGCSYPAPASEGLRGGAPGLVRRGSRGKKGRTPPGRPGTEGHLQRLQMRAWLGGLNPARGAKPAPAPRPGLLCRCQKVNPPGSPGTLRLAAVQRLTGTAEAEGAGRLPPIHPGHSLYGGRPAPPASCTGRPAPARPIPAARPPPPAPSSTARPGPAPRSHRPIAPRFIYIPLHPGPRTRRGGR